MRKYLSLAICAAVPAALFIASFVPELVSGSSPGEIGLSGATRPGPAHLLGTDCLGRDLLSRTLAGARISILIGIASRAASMALGAAFGLAAGMSGPMLRRTLDSVIEVFLSIPSLLLALALAMVLGEGYLTIVIAIAAGMWAPVARAVSARTVALQKEDFVTSARAIGAGRLRIAARYLLPALLPLLLPLATTGIATGIMLESTLSFLGLAGASSLDSLPSWGIMIQEGSRFIFDAPWLIIPPSIALTIVILAFNQIGDTLAAGDGGKAMPLKAENPVE